jgi:predicted site-specific integrase-resolvase
LKQIHFSVSSNRVHSSCWSHISSVRKTHDVRPSSLRSWATQSKIQVVRSQGGTGKRFYCLALLGVNSDKTDACRRICYARASSQHQRACPQNELRYDTGCGLNWHRPGLLALLGAVCGGTVAEVVVAHRDRLGRIGVERLEWLFKRYDTKIVVLDRPDDVR